MDERELLELAALAAGIPIAWGGPDGDMARRTDTWMSFDPLTDDGDALRLTVKLHMDVVQFSSSVRVNITGIDDYHEAHDSDPYAATRRAIVRAAAEIGRSMKATPT